MTGAPNRLSMDDPCSSAPPLSTKQESLRRGVIEGRTTAPISRNSPPSQRHRALLAKLNEASGKIFSLFTQATPTQEKPFKISSPAVLSSKSEKGAEPQAPWQGNVLRPYTDPKFLEELIKYDNAAHFGSQSDVLSFIKDLRSGLADFKIVAYQRTLDSLVDKTLIKSKQRQRPDYDSSLRKHYDKIKTAYFVESGDHISQTLNSTKEQKMKIIALIDEALQKTPLTTADVEKLNMLLLQNAQGFNSLDRLAEHYNQQATL